MSATETRPINAPALGEPTEPCRNCGAPLAVDQRYCLNCGLRRAETRLPAGELFGAPAPPPPPPPKRPSWIGSPLVGVASAAVAALLVSLGVLIGVAGDEPNQQPRTVAAAPAPRQAPINVNVSGGGGGSGDTQQQFTSDWPDGKSGYTVQLKRFANDGSVPVSDVDQAKSDAQSKGAKDVGALNSDDFSSLDPGNYVVYSGVFEGKSGKGKAAAAAKRLKKSFPGAKVIKVSSGGGDTGANSSKTVSKNDLHNLQSSSGADQQKKSAKLPEELKLQGKPPAADKKAPGGGSGGGTTIK